LGIQGTLRAATATTTTSVGAAAAAAVDAGSAVTMDEGVEKRVHGHSQQLLQEQERMGGVVQAGSATQTMLETMAVCSFGKATHTQQWSIVGGMQLVPSALAGHCLTRTSHSIAGNPIVSVLPCSSTAAATTTNASHVSSITTTTTSLSDWDFGDANSTVSQVRDPADLTACLAFNGSVLHMEACRDETSDQPTPADCATSRCRFSSLTDQLWYLNSLQQLSAAYTFFGSGGVPPGADTNRSSPQNVPMCLSSVPAVAPVNPPPPPPPAINTSQPLQVWAGPLSGGDVVVVLLNTGNGTEKVTAHWADIGLQPGTAVHVTDLWTGKMESVAAVGSLTAAVGTHDAAAYRLSATSRPPAAKPSQ
jgi:hypothetical protein